jgi:hypothetical protein
MVNSEMSELLQIRCHSRQSGQNRFELKPVCTMQCKGPFGDKWILPLTECRQILAQHTRWNSKPLREKDDS